MRVGVFLPADGRPVRRREGEVERDGLLMGSAFSLLSLYWSHHTELMSCEELHAILHLVLQAGNIMNAVSPAVTATWYTNIVLLSVWFIGLGRRDSLQNFLLVFLNFLNQLGAAVFMNCFSNRENCAFFRDIMNLTGYHWAIARLLAELSIKTTLWRWGITSFKAH